MPSFVQFMHPGQEAVPDQETSIGWNRGSHRRKFLKCSGIHLNNNWKQHHGEMVFWGEWEPESEVVGRLEKPLKEGPCYIYRPYYVIPKSFKALQNTDPFVFGSAFRYSVCQQPSHPSLRNLEKGSVILFGSSVDRKFALDTVFVVCDDYVDYGPQNYDTLIQQVDQTYRIVTISPIVKQKGKACNQTCAAKIIQEILRSYKGATFDNQVNATFSFFPCQAYTKNSLGFARPTIQMPTISDTQTQGIKITRCSVDNISNYWREVVKQVTETCSLGIFAEIPIERPE